MTDRKAIPLEKAIEWWEMRREIKENLYTLINCAKALNFFRKADAAHKLIEKIDELEGEK